MEFFDKIVKSAKGAIFVEGADAPADQNAPAPAGATQAAPVYPATAYQGATFVPSGVVDQKFVEHFNVVMATANLEGNDYLELRKGLANMHALPIPENAKYLTAFTMLGITTDHVKNTATHYINAIVADAQDFQKQSDARRTDKLQSKVAEMQHLEQTNQQRQQQIAAIQAEIQATQTQIGEINSKMVEDTAKIDGAERNYKHTMDAVINNIKQDIAAIDMHVVPVMSAQQPKQ